MEKFMVKNTKTSFRQPTVHQWSIMFENSWKPDFQRYGKANTIWIGHQKFILLTQSVFN